VYLYSNGPVFAFPGQPDSDHLDHKTYPELSAELFVTTRWSMEVAIGRNTGFNVYASNYQEAAFGMQPLTWTAKYNLALTQRLHPYLGFGWQHTGLTNHIYHGHIAIDSASSGWAAQAGLDFLLSRNWVLNADIRYLGSLEFNRYLGSISAAGYFGQYRIDPFLFGLGVAYRFASFH
jgi:outer membrane protein